jgi:hypothetical protein
MECPLGRLVQVLTRKIWDKILMRKPEAPRIEDHQIPLIGGNPRLKFQNEGRGYS